MSVIGYTVVTHHEDGSTKTLKVTAGQAAAIVAAAGGRPGSKYKRVDEAGCPEHGAWKTVPAGISQKTGKAYNAFVVCEQDDCLYRPTLDLEKKMTQGPDQAPTPEPDGPSTDQATYDELPF